MERCERCSLPIFWATTVDGTSIPIDYRRDPEAPVLLFGNVAIFVPEVRRFEYRLNGSRLWMPHTHWCKRETQRGAA